MGIHLPNSRRAMRRPANVTLREVAHAAGVSPMTVSNFINRKFELMRPETAKRIAKEVEQLGYRPQLTGRGLRAAKRFSIGMLIVDERPTFLADPFITQIVAGLTNCLNPKGYGLLLQGVHAREFRDATFFRDARTDGLCVFLSGSEALRRAMLEHVRGLGEAVVAFEETDAQRSAGQCIVRQDNFAGGRELGLLMLDLGAKDFVVLAPSTSWPTAARRRAGLRSALHSRRSPARVSTIFCGAGSFVDTQHALAAWIEAEGLPDAIVAANDQMGIAAMRLLQDGGVGIPEQVMISGFNGFEFSQYSNPMLTTVRSPAYEMGARGGDEMVSRLETGSFTAEIITLPVDVRLGGSTRTATR